MAPKENEEKLSPEKISDESGIGKSCEKIPKCEEEFTEIVVPPDGGWGWVVVAASFCCNFLVDGIVNSCGILLPGIRESFGANATAMAFVSSLLSGFYLIAGPFVSGLANRYGFRLVTMVGTVIASICFGVSYFANNIYYMYCIYSILGGIGLSMIYIPAVITVGFYFERWRALATGIAMCGSGVGTFAMGPFTNMLVKDLGWRYTILIYAVLILFCIVCGAAFRPILPTKVPISAADSEDKRRALEEADKLALLIKAHQDSEGFVIPMEIPKQSSPHTWMGVAANESYPTAAEVFRKSHTNLETRRSSMTPAATKSHPSHGNGHPKGGKFITVSVTEKDENSQEPSDENMIPLLTEKLSSINKDGQGERRNTLSGAKEHNRSRRGTLTGDTQVSRPMYRQDIFFGGSLKKIPQYQSKTSIGYHMSVTHLPTVEDVEEETEASCTICPEAVKRTLATMLDFSLMKSPSFLLLAFSGFFSMLGFYAPMLYAPERGKDENMPESATAFFLSAIGIANTFGRILCGALSSLESVNVLWINNIAITVGGLATVFSGLSFSSGYQFAYCVIFGLSMACFASLRSIIVVELMGLEKLTNAFGLLMMFQGIAAIMGAPIAGFFKDYTGGYDVSFYVAGGLYTFSALLCYPLRYVTNWENERNAKRGK